MLRLKFIVNGTTISTTYDLVMEDGETNLVIQTTEGLEVVETENQTFARLAECLAYPKMHPIIRRALVAKIELEGGLSFLSQLSDLPLMVVGPQIEGKDLRSGNFIRITPAVLEAHVAEKKAATKIESITQELIAKYGIDHADAQRIARASTNGQIALRVIEACEYSFQPKPNDVHWTIRRRTLLYMAMAAAEENFDTDRSRSVEIAAAFAAHRLPLPHMLTSAQLPHFFRGVCAALESRYFVQKVLIPE